MKAISLLFSLCLFSSVAYANDFLVDDSRVAEESGGNQSGLGFSSGTADNYKPQESDSLGTEIQDSSSFENSRQGGLEGSRNLESSGQKVNIMGLAMAAAMTPPCMATPPNPYACAAVGMSIADALAGSGAQSAGMNQGGYLDSGRNTGASEVEQQLNDLKNDLENAGYSINPDGSVTDPTGQTFTAADLASEEAISKAFGLGAGQAASALGQIQSAQAAAAKKAGIDLPDRNTASVEENLGGGSGSGLAGDVSGAGSAIGGVIEADRIIEEVEYRGGKKKGKGLSAKKAATLSKNFNGDPIGIKMADLFLIVHQKYREKKGKKNEFINKEY